MKRVGLRHEAAQATLHPAGSHGFAALAVGHRKFLVQAARRIVRLQERRRKLRRDLRVVEEELRMAKRELKAVLGASEKDLDTPMPTIIGALVLVLFGLTVSACVSPTQPDVKEWICQTAEKCSYDVLGVRTCRRDQYVSASPCPAVPIP